MTHPRHLRRASGAAVLALFVLVLAVVAFGDRSAATAAGHEAPALRAFGETVSWLGLSGYMLALSAAAAAVAVTLMRRADRPERRARLRGFADRAVFVFTAVAASGLLCQAIKHVVGRARPRFLVDQGAFAFHGPSLRAGIDSFPSGHSTSIFAAATALGLLAPRWRGPLYAVAVAVCAARVVAGAHYPSDTVAGAFLGSVVTLWVARSFALRGIAVAADPGAPRPHLLQAPTVPKRAAP